MTKAEGLGGGSLCTIHHTRLCHSIGLMLLHYFHDFIDFYICPVCVRHVMGKAFQGSLEEGVRAAAFLGMIRVQRLLLSGRELPLAPTRPHCPTGRRLCGPCVPQCVVLLLIRLLICSQILPEEPRTRSAVRACLSSEKNRIVGIRV